MVQRRAAVYHEVVGDVAQRVYFDIDSFETDPILSILLVCICRVLNLVFGDQVKRPFAETDVLVVDCSGACPDGSSKQSYHLICSPSMYYVQSSAVNRHICKLVKEEVEKERPGLSNAIDE